MFNHFFNQTFPMIEETKKAKRKPNFFMLIFYFVGLMGLCSLLGHFLLSIYIALKASFSGLPQSLLLSEDFNLVSLLTTDESNIVSLIITGVTLVMFLFFCRYYEKRYYTSMGFVRKHKVSAYLIGLGLGLVAMIGVCALSWITQSIQFTSITTSAIPIVLLTFVGYMIQGASEEVMLRGYLMPSLAARTNNVVIAVIVNTVIFALLHLANPNIGPISFINLILFGLLMSIYVLKSGNLWGACAFHAMWNFAQGSLFGISVSGGAITSSIFHFKVNKDLWFLNGGAFGFEGGLITTIILIICLIGMYFWIKKDSQKQA